MIGIKVSEGFKKLIQEAARNENRSLSNFVKHALLTYLAEKKVSSLRKTTTESPVERS